MVTQNLRHGCFPSGLIQYKFLQDILLLKSFPNTLTLPMQNLDCAGLVKKKDIIIFNFSSLVYEPQKSKKSMFFWCIKKNMHLR